MRTIGSALSPSGLDWECIDADTKYATHAIHRYSGKFIPQIAANAISLLTDEDETILDLYAGSGTTLLEAAIHKRKSIGTDLNPLAVLIASVKTTPIEPAILLDWRNQFVDQLSAVQFELSQSRLPLNPDSTSDAAARLKRVEDDIRLSSEWFTKWFQPIPLKELIWIDQNIQEIQDLRLRNVAKIAFSDVLRRSSNAHGSYPNVMFDRRKGKVGAVTPKFIRRLNEICAAVAELRDLIDDQHIPEVIEANNTNLPLTNESVDAVITHPPYIGSIPYAEYGSLSLTWLGKDPKELDAQLTGGQRQRKGVVDKFMHDYRRMFAESQRVLKNKKYLFVLVGNPTVRGERIDLAEYSVRYADEAGLRLTESITRNGINRRANKMGSETILFFQKVRS